MWCGWCRVSSVRMTVALCAIFVYHACSRLSSYEHAGLCRKVACASSARHVQVAFEANPWRTAPANSPRNVPIHLLFTELPRCAYTCSPTNQPPQPDTHSPISPISPCSHPPEIIPSQPVVPLLLPLTKMPPSTIVHAHHRTPSESHTPRRRRRWTRALWTFHGPAGGGARRRASGSGAQGER